MRISGFECYDCGKRHIGWFALRRAKRHGRKTGHQATWSGVSTDRGFRGAVQVLDERREDR